MIIYVVFSSFVRKEKKRREGKEKKIGNE